MRALALILLLPALGAGQTPSSAGTYILPKQVIAAGGATATAPGWRLTGTVGQSAVQQVSGGSYRLIGGFHGPALAALPTPIFRDGFEG